MRRPWNRGAVFSTLLVLASLVELSMMVGLLFSGCQSRDVCYASAGATRLRCTSPHGSSRPETLSSLTPAFGAPVPTGAVRSSLTHACFRRRALMPDCGTLSQLPGLFALAACVPTPATAPIPIATCPVLLTVNICLA